MRETSEKEADYPKLGKITEYPDFPAPPLNTGFTTQAQILEENAKGKNPRGLCSQFANLFASHQMGAYDGSFLKGGSSKAYDEAKKMEQHQADVQKKFTDNGDPKAGYLGKLFISFHDNQVPYSVGLVPVETLETAEGVKTTLKNAQHTLLNLPHRPEATSLESEKAGTSSSYHEVYFGHDRTGGKNKCSFFDANLQGGVREGKCEELYAFFAGYMKHTASHDGRPVLFGQSEEFQTKDNKFK